jgi:hypothetical protein
MMRLLIKLVFVGAIGLVGIGLWQGWFSFSRTSTPDTDGNRVNVNVSLDRDKMKSDVKKAKQIVKEEVGKIAGKPKDKDKEAK